MDPLILTIAVGAVAAGFVQGLSGFGFGLVAMSFWAWMLDPQLAAVLTVFGALTGQIMATLSVRRGFDLKLLLPFLVGGVAGIPIGVGLLPLLDAHMFKALLGLLLAIWCPLMLFSRELPAIRAGGRLADGAVGLLGGVMGGMGGFTGVLPTLWCTLRQLDKHTQRAIIQNFNLATIAFTMVAYVASGMVTRAMLPMFAIVAPAMLVPTYFGTRLYIGMSEVVFRRIVLSLLTASGIALLASSAHHFLGGF